MPKFVKGKSGNPKGRPKTPKELKDCTPDQIRKIIWHQWKLPSVEVQQIALDQTTPAGERFIAQILYTGIKRGDPSRFEALVNRLVGRVPMEIDVDATVDVNHKIPETREDALKILAEAKEILDADFAVVPPEGEVKLEDL